MIAVPGQARTWAASRSQAPTASRLEPAPGQLHQVEGGQEVRVEPVGGVEDAVLGERLAVAEQHVLDVRRAGLRGADVQEDLVRAVTVAPLLLPPARVAAAARRQASSTRSRAARRPGRPVAPRAWPDAIRSRSPCTA